jgi:hypothetical protein
MALEWRSVFSSNVDSIAYNAETLELFVRWTRGRKVSVYEGVPDDVADEAMRAYSVGNYIREEIKPNYRHRYQ